MCTPHRWQVWSRAQCRGQLMQSIQRSSLQEALCTCMLHRWQVWLSGARVPNPRSRLQEECKQDRKSKITRLQEHTRGLTSHCCMLAPFVVLPPAMSRPAGTVRVHGQNYGPLPMSPAQVQISNLVVSGVSLAWLSGPIPDKGGYGRELN